METEHRFVTETERVIYLLDFWLEAVGSHVS